MFSLEQTFFSNHLLLWGEKESWEGERCAQWRILRGTMNPQQPLSCLHSLIEPCQARVQSVERSIHFRELLSSNDFHLCGTDTCPGHGPLSGLPTVYMTGRMGEGLWSQIHSGSFPHPDTSGHTFLGKWHIFCVPQFSVELKQYPGHWAK
jgi:hypothetical protein